MFLTFVRLLLFKYGNEMVPPLLPLSLNELGRSFLTLENDLEKEDDLERRIFTGEVIDLLEKE